MTNSQLASDIAQIKTLLQEQQPKPMTVDEAASYLAISKSRLYAMTSRGEIVFYKPSGKRIYFQKTDLDRFLLRNRVKTREEIRQQLDEAAR